MVFPMVFRDRLLKNADSTMVFGYPLKDKADSTMVFKGRILKNEISDDKADSD